MNTKSKDTYAELVERIADEFSVAGYHQPSDLPPLSESDYAVVAAQHPDTVNEVTLDGAALAQLWAITPVDQLSARAGVYFLSAIREGLLGALYYDVMTECEARGERAQELADEAYYGGSTMTWRERVMNEVGMRAKDFF